MMSAGDALIFQVRLFLDNHILRIAKYSKVHVVDDLDGQRWRAGLTWAHLAADLVVQGHDEDGRLPHTT